MTLSTPAQPSRLRSLRPRTPVAALALLACAPVAACRRNSARPSEPVVDRASGALPSLRAPHLARGAITVDGRLSEAAWEGAGSTGPLVNPGDGHPAPDSRVNATARFAWDDDALYVGAVVYDVDPTTPFHST